MTDVPADSFHWTPTDMLTDSPVVSRVSPFVAAHHHNREVLLLREQIWQLMRDVDEARTLVVVRHADPECADRLENVECGECFERPYHGQFV